MSKDVYLLELRSYPDTSFILFEDEDIWNWIHTKNILPPDRVIDAFKKAVEPDEGNLNDKEAIDMLQGIEGTWSNDRAISLCAGCDKMCCEIIGMKYFDNIEDVLNYPNKNSFKIIGTFKGIFY